MKLMEPARVVERYAHIERKPLIKAGRWSRRYDNLSALAARAIVALSHAAGTHRVTLAEQATLKPHKGYSSPSNAFARRVASGEIPRLTLPHWFSVEPAVAATRVELDPVRKKAAPAGRSVRLTQEELVDIVNALGEASGNEVLLRRLSRMVELD